MNEVLDKKIKEVKDVIYVNETKEEVTIINKLELCFAFAPFNLGNRGIYKSAIVEKS